MIPSNILSNMLISNTKTYSERVIVVKHQANNLSARKEKVLTMTVWLGMMIMSKLSDISTSSMF
jgi:hypothetical protein